MSSNIWMQCGGASNIKRLTARPWRGVEAQHQVVTRKLVDSLEEQLLLEQMLEASKPELNSDFNQLHYLLTTPFRYPPLKYGSRFGTKQQRGIWYGATKVATVLAEIAYYRLLFLQASSATMGTVYADFTLFQVSVKTRKGIDLSRQPFSAYTNQIADPNSYKVSQALGMEMREAGVEVVRFISARDPHQGSNLALFSAHGFAQNQPLAFQHWHSVSDRDQVEFKKHDYIKSADYRFSFKNYD